MDGEGAVPQFVSIVSFGTDDLERIRSFYAGWGWRETDGSEPTWCAFDVGGTLVAFYSMTDLAEEAGTAPRPATTWSGVTLALNAPDADALDRQWHRAVAAGATVVADIRDRPWGGRSGYLADPDGNRWEFASGGPNPHP